MEQQEPTPTPRGCMFWWYSLLAKFYRPQLDAWSELKRRGWYWYYNRAEEPKERGYVIANDDYETQPIDFATSEEFFGALERFAENELKEQS